ncbi:MAG TPA: hypothetical protein VMJ10_00910, partial [Kofleriaceae bacterium]|nr:hypothetical protein [Kofleriaceae bacterium]
SLARDFDKTSAAWAVQWDAACHSDERRNDPLLHAQRLTCLENVRIELYGRVTALGDVDVTDADIPGPIGRVVEDCANATVLRAQVPAPPREQRAAVSALLVEAYRSASDAGHGEWWRDESGFDAGTARLDAIARELEALHRPSAALPLALRAELIARNSWDVASRLPIARAAIAEARARIAATRDDVMLASIEALTAMFEIFYERDGDHIAAGEAALARADEALARAGSPIEVSVEVTSTHGLLAKARGADDDAVRFFHDAAARDVSDPPEQHGLMYALALARAGDSQTARAELERQLASAIASYGEDDAITEMIHRFLVPVLDYGGDLAGSLAHQRRANAIEAARPHPPHTLAWNTIFMVDLARRVGEPNDRELLAAVHELAGHGTTPPHQSPDGISTARRAGLFATFERATELEADTTGDAGLDAAVWLAFARGDDAELARRSAQVVERCARASCDDWIRLGRWLAILVEVRAGRGGDVEARLEELERAYSGDRQAIANSGVVLASLGRWDAARDRLARARDMPNVWERQSDLLEVDAWLGLALVRAGEPAAARARFEEALDTLSIPINGLEGLSYMTPVAQLALAQLLPESDRARARRLATRARDGFARLGPHRAADRDAAAKWLVDHPAR